MRHIDSPHEEMEGGGNDTSDDEVDVLLPMTTKLPLPLSLIIPLFGLLSENPAETLNLKVSNGPDVSPDLVSKEGNSLPLGESSGDAPPRDNDLTCTTFLGLLEQAGPPLSRRSTQKLRYELEQNMKNDRVHKMP